MFWELLLNLAFAFMAPWLTTRRLAALTLASAALFVVASVTFIRIDVGASFKGVIAAGPRLTTSFLLGMLLLRAHRAGLLARGGPRWWIAPLLLLGLFSWHKGMPNGTAYDLAVILLLHPLLLLAAAGSAALLPSVARLSGDISYALYILHVPLSQLATRVMRALDIRPGLIVGIAVTAAIVIISHLAVRLYDEPLRSMLRSRFGSRGHRTGKTAAAPPTR